MKWSRAIVLLAVVVVGSSLVPVAAGAQGSGGKEALEASEVGITATEIRIGVLADVDNPFQPGLFEGSPNAVKAWAKWMNKNGGLANRKVVVDFIDTKLNADETRNAIITACSQDFAILGTAALFVNNTDDLVGCEDAAGEATGLPDFPVVTTEPLHQCSPVSHPINPPTLDCATRDDHPQTYRAGTAATNYYLKRFGKLHGTFIYPSDLLAAKNSQVPLFTAEQEAGIAADVDADVSARAPQSIYTPIIQQMKDAGSTYGRSGLGSDSTLALRKEAKIQGLTGVNVWDCAVQCYNTDFVEQGGADIEDQFVYLGFVPFEEAKSNKMMSNFLKFTGREQADGFGAQAWASAIYFRDIVEQIVETDGANGVTRAAVLAGADAINDFTAEGMIAPTDVGDRVATKCFALLQVKSSKFVRVHPKKKGTFDCTSADVATLELDLIG